MNNFCEPDLRNKAMNITIKSLEEGLSKVDISSKVPKKIREMLDFAKKICIYGYYEYEFYTLSTIYLFLLTETAIKERFLEELPEECILTKKTQKKIVKKHYSTIYDSLLKHWKIEGFEDVNQSLKSIKEKILEELPEEFTLTEKTQKKTVKKHYSTIYDSLLKHWKIEGFEDVNQSLKSVIDWLLKNEKLPKRISEFEAHTYRELRNKTAAHLERKSVFLPAMVIPIFWKIIDFINCLFDPQNHVEKPKVIRDMKEYFTPVNEHMKKIIKDKKANPS
jgi:hypothetical protein